MARKKKTLIKNLKKTTKDRFRLSLGLLTFFTLLFLPGQNIYEQPLAAGFKSKTVELPFSVPTPAPYPVNDTGYSPEGLTAQSVLVVDLPSGVFLYQKNPEMKLSPASITKIMTALVALEHYDLDQVLTVKRVETSGRVMGLVSGEKITMENLLYGALVHSANDAAFVLAENFPGGEEAFVKQMNEEAKKLGLNNTLFQNPIGFESPSNYSTAFDLFRLTVHALKNKTFTKIVGTPSITVHDHEFKYFHYLQNVNELLGKIWGVAGIKTGFTEDAGQCLVNLTKRNGREILTVILKSEDRFGETQKILDWVFLNYRWEVITPATHP